MSKPVSAPAFCAFSKGECIRPEIQDPGRRRVFFAYPGEPEVISSTIEKAASSLNARRSDIDWFTWRDMSPSGQILLCTICEAIRSSELVVADVTSLNTNVMFELGFAIGLGIPVAPVRDTTLSAKQRLFNELGVLDTLGYIEFTNSAQLADSLDPAPAREPAVSLTTSLDTAQPVFLMKAPIVLDGGVVLESALKKARLRYRTFDPRETTRISLMELFRQVSSSVGVIVEMLDPTRDQAVHNARCAFASGMAMAMGKALLMLQEELEPRPSPIDYRDIIRGYKNASNVPAIARPFFDQVVELMQTRTAGEDLAPKTPLSTIDLGDVAAENEILGLREYFLPTGPSSQAEQGHARLVIGRKGSGKTAIFYRVRDAAKRGRQSLVIEMKPDGDQFTRFKEAILDRTSAGLQEHTIVAFWQYLLTSELARSALRQDEKYSRVDDRVLERYTALAEAYGPQDPGDDLDFAQRLSWQLDRVTRNLGALAVDDIGPKLTQMLYSGDHRRLSNAVADYLSDRETIWLLVDNLDKGWPIKKASEQDILIIRALLEAARKAQHDFADRDVAFNCIIFLRSDIYELLREQTPDKGKDRPILLDWDDPQVFEQLIWLRLQATSPHFASFADAWNAMCVPLIDGQASFDYIVDRTLMRPRDLLQFLRHCIDVALSRGKSRIDADDVKQGERAYSQDMLTDFSFELSDTHPEHELLPLAFELAPARMTISEVRDRLGSAVDSDDAFLTPAIEFLVNLGFLGVSTRGGPTRYAFQLRGDTKQLLVAVRANDADLEVHPAFRLALGIETAP